MTDLRRSCVSFLYCFLSHLSIGICIIAHWLYRLWGPGTLALYKHGVTRSYGWMGGTFDLGCSGGVDAGQQTGSKESRVGGQAGEGKVDAGLGMEWVLCVFWMGA